MPICNLANQPPWRPNKHWQWGNIYFNWCFKHCFFSKECHVFSLDVNTAGNSRRVEEFVAALSSLDIPFKQQGLVITTKRIDTCPVSTLLRFLMKGVKSILQEECTSFHGDQNFLPGNPPKVTCKPLPEVRIVAGILGQGGKGAGWGHKQHVYLHQHPCCKGPRG